MPAAYSWGGEKGRVNISRAWDHEEVRGGSGHALGSVREGRGEEPPWTNMQGEKPGRHVKGPRELSPEGFSTVSGAAKMEHRDL